MALCCEMELGPCWDCHQSTLVHLERINVSHRGFGCVNCGTAKEFITQCSIEGCQEEVRRYAEEQLLPEPSICERHSNPVELVLPEVIEGEIVATELPQSTDNVGTK